MLIKWKEEYNTDIRIIDEQHQGMINTMNKLYEFISKGDFSNKIDSLLVNLIDYTHEHFGFEEKYFEEFNYEHKEHHIKEHNFFREKISGLQKKYNAEEIKTSFELIDYLEDWFIEHITGEDKGYIKLFKEKGLS